MTKTKEQQISEAFATLNAIEVLEAIPEFVAFMEAQRARLVQTERSILDDDMPAEVREQLRQFRLGALDVIDGAKKDRDGAKRFLASQGIKV